MPKTLLLADDSVVIQKLVGLSFANEDVELVTVDNGDDAIARARELGPDLVLADVVMPGKSGYEVCEAIKSDPQRGQIPVLLLTGTFEAFDEARAQAAGANGHITKPFEAQALVERVNELLTRAAQPAAAQPAGETSDFFDDNLADLGRADLAGSQQSPSAPAAPETEFAFGGEPAPPFEPLNPFESSGSGLDSLDLPPPADQSAGGMDIPVPALGGAGGDETIAIMPGSDNDPLASTADMPTPPLGMPEIPAPIDHDLGTTVLADDSFGVPPTAAEPPAGRPGFDSFENRNTAPQAPPGGNVEAPAQQSPNVPLPPASPQPPPLPGTSEHSDSAMNLDDLSFPTPPPIPADPAETMLADDLFAGAPPLSEQPAVALDAAPPSPGSGGLDLDFDTPSPGDTSGAQSPFVPDNAGDYDVSSSDLGPPPLVSPPEWDASPSLPDPGPAGSHPTPPSPSPGEVDREPFAGVDPGAAASFDPTPSEAAPAGDSGSLFGSEAIDLDADPMAETGGVSPSAGSSSPFEAPLGTPEPVRNDDWMLAEEPLTQVDALETSQPEQPPQPPAAAPVPAPAPVAAPAPAQDPGTSSALVAGKPDLTPVMRDRVHDTLEKVAWEAFSDLSETVVQQILQRVEEIAWEVIPQMTEALVREEIRRMKDEEES